MPDKLDQHDIKDLRQRLGWTLQELANYLGVDKSTVHRWERGESRPSQLAQRQLQRLHRKIKGE